MIYLRPLTISDLDKYKYWMLPIHSYHKLNGPYFKKSTEEEIEIKIENLRKKLLENSIDLDRKRIISNDKNEIIGEVSWHWRSKETFWMEIGIVIFDENFWNKGIGSQALKMWFDYLFESKKEIVRLGLTTWSGNNGMIKLSEKLGMTKEAEYRKARIVNGEYFDSISYGILREEWKILN